MRYFRQNDRTNWSGVVMKSIQKLTTSKLERDGRTSEAGWVWKRFAYIQERETNGTPFKWAGVCVTE